MGADRETFVEFSAELTGYSATDLEGTGLVDAYLTLADDQLGSAFMATFFTNARLVLRHRGPAARAKAMRIVILASPTLWPAAAALITLWYTGSWTTPAPAGAPPNKAIVPSAQAYEQQLAFRAAGAHPPGASPTGHGSWAIPPVFGDVSKPAARPAARRSR